MAESNAIAEFNIDPLVRRYSKSFDDMTTLELHLTLNIKGYISTLPCVSKAKLIRFLRLIEGKNKTFLPKYIKPMSANRYKIIDKLLFLKEHGYMTMAGISVEDINEAYVCLKEGREVPEFNRCRPDTYREGRKKQKAEGLVETNVMGKLGIFSGPDEMQMYSNVYNDFVIKRKSLEDVKKKYKIDGTQLNAIINSVRKFISTKFVPEQEMIDSLQESVRTLEFLYDQRDTCVKRLEEFDKHTEDTYDTFLTSFTTQGGDINLVVRPIASERAKLQKSVLEVLKAISDERKHSLELKSMAGGPIEPGKGTSLKTKETPTPMEVPKAMSDSSYLKYVDFLSPDDKKQFNRLMLKLAEYHIKDQENSLMKMDITETYSGVSTSTQEKDDWNDDFEIE